jgi:hypothetical protein
MTRGLKPVFEPGTRYAGGGPAAAKPLHEMPWSYAGVVNPAANTDGQRWYPGVSVTVSSVTISLATPATVTYTIFTKKNGSTVGTHTLTAGQSKTTISLSVSLTSSDYLQASIAGSASGDGLQLGITYSYSAA